MLGVQRIAQVPLRVSVGSWWSARVFQHLGRPSSRSGEREI